MPAEKALALVVRGTDWSETSRITTLFTREFGKVRGLAKGGRRLKSNFDIAFDLLNVCHIVLFRKAHGGLDLLTEAQVAERFPGLRQNLFALYAGYYIAELLADGTQEYDPHPELFDAAVANLRELGNCGNGAAPTNAARDAVISFELVWLRELGYSPRLDACAFLRCGGDPARRRAGVLQPDGGRSALPDVRAGGRRSPHAHRRGARRHATVDARRRCQRSRHWPPCAANFAGCSGTRSAACSAADRSCSTTWTNADRPDR